jgi:hypothetical protein
MYLDMVSKELNFKKLWRFITLDFLSFVLYISIFEIKFYFYR